MSDSSNAPQSSPEHDEKSGSFAPRTSGQAYFPQEGKKKKSKAPLWAAGVFIAAIAVGSVFGWQKYQQAQLASTSMVTQDLIASVVGINHEEEEHGHAAAAEPSVDKRDRARLAVERLKIGQTQLVAAAQQQPVPQTPVNVRLEESQATILQLAVADPSKAPDVAKLGLYKGILSHCYISGHDVHWLDDSGAILDHVEVDKILGEKDEAARALINRAYESNQDIVVVVYEKGIEVFNHAGQRLEAPTK